MAKGKMAEIAESFGKRLGEEFDVRTSTGSTAYCRFMPRELQYLNHSYDWEKAETLLDDLMAGRAEIVGE